jgi:AcrR family transcriptional regulator
MDAALDLLAQRGEDAVTLRELTDAAEANVAAVS